jgi:hypothetical protein
MNTFVSDPSDPSVQDTDQLEDKLQGENPFDSVKNTDALAAESSVARNLEIVVTSTRGLMRVEKSLGGDRRQVEINKHLPALAAIHSVIPYAGYAAQDTNDTYRFINNVAIPYFNPVLSRYSLRNDSNMQSTKEPRKRIHSHSKHQWQRSPPTSDDANAPEPAAQLEA